MLSETNHGDLENWTEYSAQYSATEARQMRDLCSQLNGPALCTRASSLRGGIGSTVDLSPKALSAMMGGQNCHAEVVFEDGVRWIVRFRLAKTSSPPREIRDYLLQSEAATMRYLQMHTEIPCPTIHDWACEADETNTVGAGYILMDKVEGQALNWQSLTPPQREKVMQQLADVLLELEKHPFNAMGSIITPILDDTRSDSFQVGGMARTATFRGGTPLGPFNTSLQATQEMLRCYLERIASGEVGGSYPVDVYLTHRFCLDALSSIWTVDQDKEESFFLMHPDDKGDHILVDKHNGIVGIVDWEWAQTVPKQLAFSSPCMMWPVSTFYEGSNSLSADETRFAEIFQEKGRCDLTERVLLGRKVQRFFFFLGIDPSYTTREEFLALFAGLRRAFSSSGTEEADWETWKIQALREYGTEEALQALLLEEKEGLVSS